MAKPERRISCTKPRACTHAHTHAPTCRRHRSLKANRLTILNVPDKNGTCCATTVHVGPTQGPGEPQYRRADGLLFYFMNKTIPIGKITACATDAANPGKRKNTDPTGEERYTFTLTAERACDSNVNLTTTAIQARPPSTADALGECPIASSTVAAVAYVSMCVSDNRLVRFASL
jgi:hypothetical protein